jgi:MYXO-CTERM domain-containing protein
MDCGAPFVCDPVRKACTECTPTATGACDPELAGAACLTGGQCGCTTDAECGSVSSGRVCDATINRCTPGCRGMGGNGCPVSELCSSTTTSIGSCAPRQSPDGGAGEGDASVDGGRTSRDGGGEGGAGGSSADGGAGAHGGSSGEAGAGGGEDGGETPDSSVIRVNGWVAGGGCRCDTTGGGPSGGVLVLLALVVLLARRARPRRRDERAVARISRSRGRTEA